MLVTLKEICAIAEEKKIAVGAFNAISLASLKAVFAAAEELNTPFVIMYAQLHHVFNDIEDIGPLMVKYAKRSSVPVCVMLDHGEDLEFVKKALEIGFTAVMIDGSGLPYEENVKITKAAVEMAKTYGADVEGELGTMGKRELGGGNADAEHDATKIYTDPELAARFVKETGVAALACSFGTTHGIYLTAPKLNFDIVRQVRENTSGIPVVMHGGSGVSLEDFHHAIDAGVRKINYFTYMDKAGAAAAKEYLDGCTSATPVFTKLCAAAETAMKENVAEAIKKFAKA